jgi:hypothetical protein
MLAHRHLHSLFEKARDSYERAFPMSLFRILDYSSKLPLAQFMTELFSLIKLTFDTNFNCSRNFTIYLMILNTQTIFLDEFK